MKQLITTTILASFLAFIIAIIPTYEESMGNEAIFATESPVLIGELSFSQFNALLPIPSSTPQKVIRTIRVVVTAYSSTPEQTDDTPFITASGTRVRDGIVAANFLPMGTKIKLPDIYGDRIFVVEDRMHPRKKWMVDIWFASYTDAKEFGAKTTYVEVLEG